MLIEIISWLIFSITLIVITIDLMKDIIPKKKDRECIVNEKMYNDFVN